MGQLIIPSDKRIKGPWLLDKSNLVELNETLETIEKILYDACSDLVEQATGEKLEELKKWDENATIEKARADIEESYQFRKTEKYVEVKSKTGEKIRDNSLVDLLKDPKVNYFDPIALRVHIEKGPSEFNLEISSEFFGELDTRILIPDAGKLDNVNYELSKWIDKYKPNWIVQLWPTMFPFSFILFFLIVMILLALAFQSPKDLYEVELNKRMENLLENGISSDEQNEAFEILIQKSFGYTPEDYNPNVTFKIGSGGIIVLIATIMIMIHPSTTIGIGRNTWKVKFYKTWIYIVLVFVPFSIIWPFIQSKLF